MALDPKYIIASDLISAFLDKSTGLPLANGKIHYFSDNDHITPKPIYEISGTPPNYTYTALPNPIILNAVGQVVNGTGDIVVPYYKPYHAVTGAVEYYFVKIENSNQVEQTTQVAWPNQPIDASQDNDIDVINFITNPQFWLNNDIYAPNIALPTLGVITQAVTEIAPGEIYLAKTGTSASDKVTFPNFGSFVLNPSNSPRFNCQVVCTAAGTDTYKRVEFRFPDVNRFSSATQFYTVAISMKGTVGAKADIGILKHFGTGGTPTADEFTLITPVSTSTSWAIYQKSFTFGVNTGKTLGSNNDDYVAIVINFAPTSLFTVDFTDVLLTPHALTVTGFPDRTNQETKALSFSGSISELRRDGYDFYAPLVLTPKGVEAWHGFTGKIFMEYRDAILFGPMVLCDGAQYATAEYHSTGVPFARLQAYLWSATAFVPITGTGPQYFTALINSTTSHEVIISNNTAGAFAAATVGTLSPGFSPVTIAPGVAVAEFISYREVGAQSSVIIENKKFGPVLAAPTSTVPWIVSYSTGYDGRYDLVVMSKIEIIADDASTVTPGQYIAFETVSAGFAAQKFHLWFKVNGAGAAPVVPGSIAIEVDLSTGDLEPVVSDKIMMALNQWQVTKLLATSAATIPTSSYLNFHSSTLHYIVWFRKDGVGSQPTTVADRYVRVDILSADTNSIVAAKIRTAINMENFSVPDLRGMFMRAADPLRRYDVEADLRYSLVPGIYGNRVGTFERDTNLSHEHLLSINIAAGLTPSIVVDGGNAVIQSRDYSAHAGDFESRPRNAYFTPVIMI